MLFSGRRSVKYRNQRTCRVFCRVDMVRSSKANYSQMLWLVLVDHQESCRGTPCAIRRWAQF